jgi:hypothetical protein
VDAVPSLKSHEDETYGIDYEKLDYILLNEGRGLPGTTTGRDGSDGSGTIGIASAFRTGAELWGQRQGNVFPV